MSNQQSLEALLALANQAAETGENMTEAVKGGGGARLLPEGYCLATLVEYIEYGQQPQEFGGVAKDPQLEFQLGFALHTPGFCNEDGTPYIFRPYAQGLSRNEKANAFLTFRAMNWKGTKTHYAQLLNDAFLLKFSHKQPNAQQAAAGGKVKSVVDLKATLPPMDALSKMPYPVPTVDSALFKLFLWQYPQIETWASFFQEGKYDDGNSKNVVQDKMLSALDFEGSALQALLIEKQVPYVKPTPKAASPKPAAPAAPAGPGPAAPPNMGAVAMPAVPATPAAIPAVAPVPVVPAAAPPFDGGTPAVPAVAATPAPAPPAVASPVLPAVESSPVVAPPPVVVAAPAAIPANVAMPSFPAMPAMPA